MRNRFAILTAILASALLPAAPSRAAINNGFDSSLIYATQEPTFGTTPNGRIVTFRKSDAGYQSEFMGPNNNYQYLTFAGQGTNDARLYAVKDYIAPGDSVPTDVQIDEINAGGTVVNSARLSTIVGQPIGPNVLAGKIRYSPYLNSLMVAVETDFTSGADNARVYEVNLGLNSLHHTYIGPNTWADEGLGLDTNRGSRMFLSGLALGSAANDVKGDLVSFDLTGRVLGGTTNVYTTLIEGSIENWNGPKHVIFRDSRNPTGQDTVVIVQREGSFNRAELPYYLNQTQPNGNLLSAGAPLYTAAFGWGGIQDPITGEVYIAHARSSIRIVHNNNTIDQTSLGFGGQNRWYDVGTPLPEPATAAFLLLGSVCLLRRRACPGRSY